MPPTGDFRYKVYKADEGEPFPIVLTVYSVPRVSLDGILLENLDMDNDILHKPPLANFSIENCTVPTRIYGVPITKDGQKITIYFSELQKEYFGTYHVELVNPAGLKSAYTFSIVIRANHSQSKPVLKGNRLLPSALNKTSM